MMFELLVLKNKITLSSLFSFGCAMSSWLHVDFYCCGAWAFHSGGFSCSWARALGCLGFSSSVHGLSSCGSQALEHRLNSWWRMDLVVPQHVGSSQSRDHTHVSCIGSRILYHWATNEALSVFFFLYELWF